MTTFLDTNVVIALLDNTDEHHEWSKAEVKRRRKDGPTIVSDIVYCEVSIGMKDQAEVDAAIARLGLQRLPSTDAALVRAGQVFKHYRDVNKGPKLGVLPDFLIGAQAEAEAAPLVTANSKDFVGYFPNAEIVAPPKKVKIKIAGKGKAKP